MDKNNVLKKIGLATCICAGVVAVVCAVKGIIDYKANELDFVDDIDYEDDEDEYFYDDED